MAFEAKHWGICRNCGERIKPGDLVDFLHSRVVHHDCSVDSPEDIDPDRLGPQERKCPRCFTIHAGECF
ncbi:Uncharacterised protein [Mycobacteroides abscessus subsp. abscessus]|nr:Uncharacterised protein [Mycobacteroides abscessus subsp. abscessus]